MLTVFTVNLENYLVAGVSELFGEDAKTFRKVRTQIEESLEQQGFNFYFPGMVSKKRLYSNFVDEVGERFLNNLVGVELEGETGIIVRPEGTLAVLDYVARSRDLPTKVYYSQEFLRNEPFSEVKEGKTRAFWQIGFELVGYSLDYANLETIKSCIEAVSSSGLQGVYARITDKRILSGILEELSLNDQQEIRNRVDLVGENPNEFLELKSKKNDSISKTVAELLALSSVDNPFNEMRKVLANYPQSLEGVDNLENLYFCSKEFGNVRVSPVIGKGWEVYNQMMVEIKCEGYPYALGGGGDYSAMKSIFPNTEMTGAGLGLTRIIEALLQQGGK